MKKHIAFLLFLFATGQAMAQDLTVNLQGIKSPGKGSITFLLFTNSEGFPKEKSKAFRSGKVSNFGTSASYVFKGVPAGKYAVTVLQDKNGNGEIDTNLMGMPKEPVGVSNQSGFGRPSFEKSAFSMNGERKVIEVRFMND